MKETFRDKSFIGKGIANPGLQALWAGERSRRTKLNITDRLTPPTSPGKNSYKKSFLKTEYHPK